MGFDVTRGSVHGKILHRADTLGTNILSVERHDLFGTVTEDTSGLILLHHDAGAVDVDLQTVSLCDIQSTAQLDGQDNAAQLINFSYNTGRFHFSHPFPDGTVKLADCA